MTQIEHALEYRRLRVPRGHRQVLVDPPLTDVAQMVLANRATAAERADSYEISRGLLSQVGASYGSCLESGLLGLTRDDPDLPPVNEGYLYLIGARDSGCGGGGSTGTDSADTPRTSPCP